MHPTSDPDEGLLKIYGDAFADEGPQAGLLAGNTRDMLYQLSGSGEVRPGLAVGHQANGDGRVHEFTIAGGRLFHDGTPLTARDCAFSLARAVAELPPDAVPAVLHGSRFEAVDDRRLRVVLTRPERALREALAAPAFAVLSEDAWLQRQREVWSGPYEVKAVTPDRIVLAAHPQHPAHGPRPFPRLSLERIPANSSHYRSLLDAGRCVLLGTSALVFAARNRALGRWATYVFATGNTHVLSVRAGFPAVALAKSVLQRIFSDRSVLGTDGHLREAVSFYPKGSALHEPVHLRPVPRPDQPVTLRLALARGLLAPVALARIADEAAAAGIVMKFLEVDPAAGGDPGIADAVIVPCAIDGHDPIQVARRWFTGERGVAGPLPQDLARLLERAENAVRRSDRAVFLRQFYFNLFAGGNAVPLFFSPNALVHSLDVDTSDLDFYAGFLALTQLQAPEAVATTAGADEPGIDVKMLAHDLRKPFTLVKALVNMLKGADDLVRLQSMIEAFTPELIRASTAVDEMLRDMMRRDPARLPRLATVSPRAVIADAVALVFPEGPPPSVSIELGFRHERCVEIERDKIERVFANLLQNAVQAMHGCGRIWVRTADVATQAGSFVEFRVGNTNSYIAADDLKNLFKPYFTKNKAGGTGLGLAIVQKFVNAHGGAVAVRSSREEGTEFTLILPAVLTATDDEPNRRTLRPAPPPTAALAAPAAVPAPAKQTVPLRIAVLEDNIFLLEAWQQQWGADVHVFERPEDFFAAAAGAPEFLSGLHGVVTDYYFEPKSQLTGADVARFLSAQRFGAPVLLASDSCGLGAEISLFHGLHAKEPSSRAELHAKLSCMNL